jgi:hypothetical protein
MPSTDNNISSAALPVQKRVSSLAGEGKIWLCALGLTLGLLMTIGLLLLILVEGLVVFWPREIVRVTIKGKPREQLPRSSLERLEKFRIAEILPTLHSAPRSGFSSWVTKMRRDRTSDSLMHLRS